MDGVLLGGKQGTLMAVSCSAVITGIIVLFGNYLMGVFTTTEALVDLSMHIMRILAVGDVVGSIVIRKLRSLGYRVPEDVSVVGYDNYLYPGLCDIGITTYEVDMKKMAARALDFLLERLRGADSITRLHIVEGHLVEKDSVGIVDFCAV